MASPSQQGILVGGYYPSLSEFDYGLKHAHLKYTDNYVKYFKPLGIRRYEMMRLMPTMMQSDVLLGLDKPDYLNEGKKPKYITIEPDLEKSRVWKCKTPYLNKIEFEYVVPDISGFSDKQKGRFDKEGMSRWFLKIYHNKDKLTDAIINDINDVVISKNSLKIKYLKCSPDLCSYISQKSRIQGETSEKQDIKNASVIIEPLHNDLFNMVIPHIPVNQSIPTGTSVVLSIDVPFKGSDSLRKLTWSSNLDTDSKISETIKKNKPDSIYIKPWLDCVHMGSIDLGSSIKGKFTVSLLDTDLQQSYQIYTFRREAEDEYFELGMYVCYNMRPVDLIDKILEVIPNNTYLKDVRNEITSE